MYRASRAVTLAAKTSEPLPRVPFLESIYEDAGDLYRGSLIMIAGQPGSSKSMFALNLVHQMALPTLYLSADSDSATQTSRLAAIITGVTSASIRNRLKEEAENGGGRFTDALTSSRVQFNFDAEPEVRHIEEEISAWVEMYDTYPEVIVVDNLRNVWSGNESEHGGYKVIQQALIEISRATGAAVITLHHMSESNNQKATDPAPRSAVDGKVNQLPAQIFSVARDGDEFRMCVVKNREAPQHPEAGREHWHYLRSDAPTSRFFALPSVQTRANMFNNNSDPYAGMRVGA